jgi:hypothetical protein
MGIYAEMPEWMSKGQKQLESDDANGSRLVTTVRCWLVNILVFVLFYT